MRIPPPPRSRHEMVLDADHGPAAGHGSGDGNGVGAERWTCRTCGRVMEIRWVPDFERTVLVPGDEEAIHVGGKGGPRLGSVSFAEDSSAARLAPGPADREWLAEHGIRWD